MRVYCTTLEKHGLGFLAPGPFSTVIISQSILETLLGQNSFAQRIGIESTSSVGRADFFPLDDRHAAPFSANFHYMLSETALAHKFFSNCDIYLNANRSYSKMFFVKKQSTKMYRKWHMLAQKCCTEMKDKRFKSLNCSKLHQRNPNFNV